FELSLVASAHERRNRPRGILIAAIGAVLLMAIFAGYGLRARGAARDDLRKLVSDQAVVDRLADEFKVLDALANDPGQGGGGRVGRHIPNLLTRMEELAVQAGIDKPRPPRVQPGDARAAQGAIRVTQYHYTDISHATLP